VIHDKMFLYYGILYNNMLEPNNMKKQKKKYSYPIIIKNEISCPFFLSGDIQIQKLTKQNKLNFFGINDVDFTWGANCRIKLSHVIINKIQAAESKGRRNYKEIMKIGLFDGTNEILASNYVLIVKSHFDELNRLIERINMAFKLLRPTSTGGYLGFVSDDTDVHFHHQYPIPIRGPFDYLKLQDQDLIKIKSIYEQLEKNKSDKKLTGALLHFSRALENISYNKNARMDIRFLLLMIVLDLLYIPDGQSSARKMASRIFNILNVTGITHQEICDLYDIRNDIIHDGRSDRLTDNDFYKITEIVRQSLNFYLINKKIFAKNNLKK